MFVFSTVLAITAVLTIATAIDGNSNDTDNANDDENDNDDDNDDGQIKSKEKRGSKRGAKKGSKYASNKKTKKDWYNVCALYCSGKHEGVSQAKFLESAVTGDLFTGSRTEQTSFSAQLEKFKATSPTITHFFKNK